MKNQVSRRQFLTQVGSGAVGLAGILAAGCSPTIPARDKAGRYNLVLISVDTLRADHLGCYGYQRQTSPNIDAFAEKNILFENFFTVAPSTGPSMTSFFTGKYSKNHGVISNRYYWPKSTISLAEVVPKDYRKAAYLCNGNLCRPIGYWGFDMGKHVLCCDADPSNVADQKRATRNALDFLDDIKKDENFFLWLHYIDPHTPYIPSDEFSGMFVGDELYDETKTVALDYVPREGFNKQSVIGAVPMYARDGDHNEVDYYIAQYDAEIRHTDKEVGIVLEFLESKGLMENSIVVITSDHGESLGENNCYYQHGLFVDDANIHIPFIMRHPKISDHLKIESLLQNTDFAPTILDELGLRFPTEIDRRGVGKVQTSEIDGINFSRLYRDVGLRDKGIIKEQVRPFIYSCSCLGLWKFYETIRTPEGKLVRSYPIRAEGGAAFGILREGKDAYTFFDISNNEPDAEDKNILSEVDAKLIDRYRSWLAHVEMDEAVLAAKRSEEFHKEIPKQVEDNLKALGYIE